MRAWVDYVHRANPALLWTEARGYDNGDWLSVGADTDKDLIATAYFAHSTRLTAQAAEVVRPTEAAALHELADQIRDAFCSAFLLPDGRLRNETQTAYALALRFGLIPPDLAAGAAARLVADVEARGNHLTTGFLGVGQLLPALTDAGYDDAAYALLLQDDFPSWLYAVRAGATTIWERWDGWTEDGGYGDPAMNSYNHYALGSVGEWLYRTVAGIGYAGPGGRRLVIAPRPHPALRWAQATHRSPYGVIRSRWELDGQQLRLHVQIPVGTTAVVTLPTGDPADVLEGGRPLLEVLTITDRTADALHVELGSGTYSFTITAPSRSTPPPPREAPMSDSRFTNVRVLALGLACADALTACSTTNWKKNSTEALDVEPTPSATAPAPGRQDGQAAHQGADHGGGEGREAAEERAELGSGRHAAPVAAPQRRLRRQHTGTPAATKKWTGAIGPGVTRNHHQDRHLDVQDR